MPCEFSLGYASPFEPRPTFDPNSENAFGNKCQFAFFDENQMMALDGKKWCPFHFPLADRSGNSTPKREWDFHAQAHLSGLLSEYIEGKRVQGKSIDLCGLVHWDRLTFAMRYSSDFNSGQTTHYKNLPALALDGAQFPRGVDFRELHFAKRVYARNVVFGGQAEFSQTRFSDHADFSGSVFADDAVFFDTKFEKRADFSGVRFRSKLVFALAEFSGEADFSLRHMNAFLPPPESEESIQMALFHDAKFLGPSRFNDRIFLSGPSFQRAEFCVAPEFHNASFHQSANFDGANFSDTSSRGADHAYRTLKLAMERLGARDEQANFFALEQRARAEKPLTPCSVKFFSYLYWLSSDFGQSFIRPLVLLAAVTTIFGLSYALTMPTIAAGQTPSLVFIAGFTLEQLIRPFSIWGPDALTKSGLVPASLGCELVLKVIATVHALASLGLIALALLALRRRFKLD